MSSIRGVRPFSPRSVHAERKGLAPMANPIGHAQGPRISLARRLSSVRVRRAPPFPDRPTVGRPVVNRSIQVRVLVGEPVCRARLVARTCRFSTGRPEFESPSRHQSRTRSSMDKAPGCGPGRCRSNPAVCSNHQRVGEPGRPCLAWNQEIGGSNPPALTNCPRSSVDESGRLLSGGSGVQVTPRAPT
jgi:hypothetical protein